VAAPVEAVAVEEAEERIERPRRSRERDDGRSDRVRSSWAPPPRQTDDPLFSRPYEPDAGSGTGGGPAVEPPRAVVRRTNRPVPALLGGFKKP
jgi:hypothetical protein